MTRVTRRLARQTMATVFSNGRRRPVIVEILPPGLTIGFRLHGERRRYDLPVDALYKKAALVWTAEQRAARRRK